MRPADFEILVSRTRQIARSSLPRGLVEAIARKRAAATGCRTLYAYGERLETSSGELAVFLSDVLAQLPSPSRRDAPSPAPPPPTSLALARVDPRFRRRRPTRAKPESSGKPPAIEKQADRSSAIGEARRVVLAALNAPAPSTRAIVLAGLLRELDGAETDAEACYRLALRQDPGSPDALKALMGLSARQTMRHTRDAASAPRATA